MEYLNQTLVLVCCLVAVFVAGTFLMWWSIQFSIELLDTKIMTSMPDGAIAIDLTLINGTVIQCNESAPSSARGDVACNGRVYHEYASYKVVKR